MKTQGRDALLPFSTTPRTFILTDITNEPDDAESFCRYLTYANQFQTEGVIATTSVWLRDKVVPESLYQIIDAYEKVVENLNAHVHPDSPYPSPAQLRSVIRCGAPVFGMAAVGDNVPLSEGATLLLERLREPLDKPLWVLVWGGVNVLAQVLHHIRKWPNAALLRSCLRVYTISDQDDCGAYIRHQWPDVFYICSLHGWNQYENAAWRGISDAVDGDGPDAACVTHDWVRKNIQVGPLGLQYPDHQYIIEGDTPTFLYLIQNGLGVPEQPSYGCWGGRYLPMVAGMGGDSPGSKHFSDAVDRVIGLDGREYTSSQATIWRWRTAFQNDFATRMRWTLSADFETANHAPVAIVNGQKGFDPIHIEAAAGEVVELDASESYDPDGDVLAFKWTQYREPSSTQTYRCEEVTEPDIVVTNASGQRVQVKIPQAKKSCILFRENVPLERGVPLHFVLQVTDDGEPRLTSYRRVIIQPINREFIL